MMQLHAADYAVFAFLLLISALVGPYYMWRDRHKTTTSESYFSGNRALHIIPTAASLFASFWSAISLVGVPAELYTGGARFFINSVGQSVGIAIAAFIAVPVFYKLRLISSYEYFEMRFKSKLLRKIGTIANIFANIFYLAIVTYSPCIALEAVSPIPIWASVTGTAAITMIYTVLGGIKAVVLVDLIQAVVMVAGVVAGVVVGFMKIDGGFSRAMQIAYDGGRLDFFDFNPDPTNIYNFWIMMFPPIVSNAGLYATSQAAIQRYSALPTARQATWSVFSLAPQIMIIQVLLFFLALAMFAYYDVHGCDPLRGGIISSPNQLTTFYIADILHYPGFVGLWFAALFSGSLSSMSTGYNSVAACVWEDLLKERLQHRLTPVQVSRVFKLISLLLGIISCLLAVGFKYLPGSGSVIKLSTLTISVFGFVSFMAFFNGALFPWVNSTGTIVGMIVSTIAITFMSIGQLFFKVSNSQNSLPSKTENCTAFKAYLVASGKFKAPKPSSSNLTGIATGLLLLTSTAHVPTIGSAGSNSTITVTNNPPSSEPFVELPYYSTIAEDLFNVASGEGDGLQMTTMPSTVQENLASNNYSNPSMKTLEQRLPEALKWLFSISYFVVPFLALILGIMVAVLVSLCTGGVKMAAFVPPRLLIVKNCFWKSSNEIEEEEIGDKSIDDASAEKTDSIEGWYESPTKPPVADYKRANLGDDYDDDGLYQNIHTIPNPVYRTLPQQLEMQPFLKNTSNEI